MRKDFFIFGGVNSLDYGVLLDGSGTTTAPERDVTTVTIPGRSGDLLVDAGRWKNTTVSYPCTIAREFEGRFAAFKQALLAEGGYKRAWRIRCTPMNTAWPTWRDRWSLRPSPTTAQGRLRWILAANPSDF